MANRAHTLLGTMPTPSTVTASSQFSGTYPASKGADRKLLGGITPWLTQNPAVYPEYLTFDFGSTQTFDSAMIAGADATNSCVKNGGIEYSSDNTNWFQPGGGSEFTNLHGAAAPSTVARFATVTFTATSARYWRLRIDSTYTAGYSGTNEFVLFSAAGLGARLDNDAALVITAPDYTTNSASELSNRVWTTYGLYNARASAVSTFELDLAGAANYFAGFDYLTDLVADSPLFFYVFYSDTGTAGSWLFGELTAAVAGIAGALQTFTASRIYYHRYIKIIVVNSSSGFLVYEWFLYATATPAVPPDPTSVTAKASATGTDIELTWSEIAGDDNLLGDIVFDITRQKDGGGYSSIATGVVAQTYVDKSVAAGSYDYKVQARNLYHARTSTAVQSSASVTSPAQIALAITTTVLDDAQLGVAYNAQISATGGTPGYTYDKSAGSLPTGLTLNADGTITGTPTALGTGNFTARVTDSVSATDTQALSIAVGGAGLAVDTDAADDAQVAKAYHLVLGASGGLAPYTWSKTVGVLPAGLTLSSGGVISGTPTSTTPQTFTVQVLDAMGGTATKQLTISVNGGGGGTPAGAFAKAASQVVG